MKKTKIIGSVGATGTGTAVAFCDQAAAMGIATTFGTASKGTAIFSLTGVTVKYMAWWRNSCCRRWRHGSGSAVLASILIAGAVIAIGDISYGCYKYFKKNKY